MKQALLEGFDRRSETVNGVETVILEIGAGPPLVYLHGTGTFPGFEMARQWARSHRVVIPFLPNFGLSGDRTDYDDVGDYVLHCLDLFDHLGLELFALAGFSLGGWIAAEAALCQPKRFSRLVLVAPAGLVDNDAPAPDLFAIAPQEVPGFLAHDPSRILHHFPSSADPQFDTALGREMAALARVVATNNQGNPTLGRWLHRLSMPVLLLWGAEDRLRPAAQASSWSDALPDAKTIMVDETGHLVFEETPVAASHVTQFLQQ